MLQFVQILSVEKWRPLRSCSCVRLDIPLFFFGKVFGTVRYSWLFLYFPYSLPEISHFPRSSGFFSVEWYLEIKPVLLTIILYCQNECTTSCISLNFSYPICGIGIKIGILFWLYCTANGILVPQPGVECRPSAVKVLSPNDWTSRNSPKYDFCHWYEVKFKYSNETFSIVLGTQVVS